MNQPFSIARLIEVVGPAFLFVQEVGPLRQFTCGNTGCVSPESVLLARIDVLAVG
ncbi:UNVERIFIED_ORG: hypothetical protein GGE63_000099 [Rhizobium esperanzae]